MNWIDEMLEEKANEFAARDEDETREHLIGELRGLRASIGEWARFMFASGFDGRETLLAYVRGCEHRHEYPSELTLLWIGRAWKRWRENSE